MAVVNLDTSSRLDITCRKGDTFSLTIDFNETLTTDYPSANWKMQIRDSDTGTGGPSSGGTATYTASGANEFTVTVDELKIDIPSSDTQGWASGTYVYDMQTSDSGSVRTWLHGLFTIVEDVTE
jgi:hypothetical protein